MIAQRDPTKSEQLFQELYDSIRQGELPHGTRLTTEAELAREHHCSRVTVRAGLRRLEELKLIRRVRRDGTDVDCSGKRFSSRQKIDLSDCDRLIFEKQLSPEQQQKIKILQPNLMTRETF